MIDNRKKGERMKDFWKNAVGRRVQRQSFSSVRKEPGLRARVALGPKTLKGRKVAPALSPTTPPIVQWKKGMCI